MSADYLTEARAFVDNLPNDDGFISGYIRNGVQYGLTAEGLRGVLDELEQRREGVAVLRATWNDHLREIGAAPQQPAPTVAELHARFAHPFYEYATTQGPRKKWDQIDELPEGDGWERNIDAGRPGEGWERFDYHEESYWRRLRPAAICGFPSCGHPEHQAASDSKGGNEQ